MRSFCRRSQRERRHAHLQAHSQGRLIGRPQIFLNDTVHLPIHSFFTCTLVFSLLHITPSSTGSATELTNSITNHFQSVFHLYAVMKACNTATIVHRLSAHSVLLLVKTQVPCLLSVFIWYSGCAFREFLNSITREPNRSMRQKDYIHNVFSVLN